MSDMTTRVKVSEQDYQSALRRMATRATDRLTANQRRALAAGNGRAGAGSTAAGRVARSTAQRNTSS